jgi:hypothetical protein
MSAASGTGVESEGQYTGPIMTAVGDNVKSAAPGLQPTDRGVRRAIVVLVRI